MNLIKILKHRLRIRRNERFLKWSNENNPNMDNHHLTGSQGKLKLNDLLIAPLTREQHNSINSKSPMLDDIELLILALENLCDYVEYLQNENKR